MFLGLKKWALIEVNYVMGLKSVVDKEAQDVFCVFLNGMSS